MQEDSTKGTPNPSISPEEHHSHWKILGVSVVALLLASLFWIFAQNNGGVVTDYSNQNIYSDEINKSLSSGASALPADLAAEITSSRIYLALAPKGSSAVQSYALENGYLTNPQTDDNSDIFYTFSPNRSKLAFFAAPLGTGNEISIANVTLYSADPESVPSGNPFPSLEEASALSNESVQEKRLPAVSDNGDVLFVGLNGSYTHITPPAEDWTIYLTSKDGDTAPLGSGFMPKWIGEDSFVFLKNDGLYEASVDDIENANVIYEVSSEDQPVLSNNRIDTIVSGDAVRIAWSNPKKSEIKILNLDNSNNASSLGTVSARGFWTEFSPSGKYLAVQTIRKEATGAEENPDARIEFFDLETLTKISGYYVSLERFNQLSAFMTEWVSNK